MEHFKKKKTRWSIALLEGCLCELLAEIMDRDFFFDIFSMARKYFIYELVYGFYHYVYCLVTHRSAGQDTLFSSGRLSFQGYWCPKTKNGLPVFLINK